MHPPSIRQTLKHTLNTTGLRGVYAGFWASAFASMPGTLFFLWGQTLPHRYFNDRWYTEFSRGFSGHLIGGLVWEPFSRISYLQQAAVNATIPTKLSCRDAAKMIYKKRGIRGFYQGALLNILSCSISDGIGFSLRAVINKHLYTDTQRENIFLKFLTTFMCFSLTAGMTIPLDVVVTRIKLSESNPTRFPDRHFIPAAKNLYKEFGWRGFRRSILTSMLTHGFWTLSVPFSEVVAEKAKGYIKAT